MSDPTKHLPWAVEKHPRTIGASQYWSVCDSEGLHILTTSAEALARMVAAGSVAGQLYAACELAQLWLANSVPMTHLDGPKPLPVLANTLATAAPFVEGK